MNNYADVIQKKDSHNPNWQARAHGKEKLLTAEYLAGNKKQ